MFSRTLRVVRTTRRLQQFTQITRCFSSRSEWGGFSNFLSEKDEDTTAAQEEEALRQQELKNEFENKKGRGWTDPWDLTDMMDSKEKFDDLPDWSPSLVSRISQERVQIHPDKIPTLQSLAQLALPPPPPPHPGQGQAKAYALARKRAHYKYIRQKVQILAQGKIESIQKLSDWQDKQDAVDELFEDIEFKLKDQEAILGKHPNFSSWVEKALEDYLKTIQTTGEESVVSDHDTDAVPIFMDCYGPSDSATEAVPKVLSPLRVNERGTTGNMVEEWELSAHKTSKRIMLRHCTRAVARALVDAPQARILLSGRQGVGKTAAVAAIVASARTSGYIVLYLPNGDQLHQNGFYIEPNETKSGFFDLPVLSQMACKDFLSSHETDLASFAVDKEALEKHFSEDKLERLFQGDENGNTMNVIDLLKFGTEHKSYAGSCYAVAVECLMNQEEKPFLLVLDEFNCFFKPGQYFHLEYDEDVKKPIPYDQISLFKPVLNAMALCTDDEGNIRGEAKVMKKGAVLVSTTESHAVPRAVTETLVANAKKVARDENQTIPLYHFEVPRLSALEVEHMLANYEATGIGRLRLDQGETVMNDQEVAFLRMVSGGVPQKLIDACIV